jgi:hypothetical protein
VEVVLGFTKKRKKHRCILIKMENGAVELPRLMFSLILSLKCIELRLL